MNSKVIALIITVMSLTAIGANAQAPDHNRVKIMRTPDAGVIKLLYANPTDEPLTVTFSNENGEISVDKIKGHYPKGFLKRYDVSEISNKDFKMEIKSDQMTVVYRITPSQDRKTYVSQLERTVYNNSLIAQK